MRRVSHQGAAITDSFDAGSNALLQAELTAAPLSFQGGDDGVSWWCRRRLIDDVFRKCSVNAQFGILVPEEHIGLSMITTDHFD